MRELLLHYYERELAYLRRMGAEFGQRYPKIAGRLLLEPNKCDDPHVERMLEAFAFLAARVHLRIDDDFPEISEALLSVVYPHYVRPIPSMSLVELRLDPDQGKLATGHRLPRDTTLYSRPVEGVPCRFKTCFDTTLWPVAVTAAQWVTPERLRPAARLGDAVAALRLELRCFTDVSFSRMTLSSLRLYLNGEGTLVSALYELLCNNSRTLLVREIPADGARTSGQAPSAAERLKSITLPAASLQPAGFGPDEGMLPYPGRSFQPYRLLQEYFTFPEKFLFLDLGGFEAIRGAGMGRAIEVIIPIGPFERIDWRPMLEAGVSASTFRVGCTPVVNLFPQVSEPIPLSQQRHEYQVIPDARRRLTTEIFSVDDVVAVTPGSKETLRCEPFHGHRHGGPRGDGAAPSAYWLARRQPSGWRSDSGTDVMLSFVDLSGGTLHPERDVATARLTCFNSDLPSRLPFGNERGDFTLESGGPIREIVALVKPTRVVQPPLGGPQLWRLISQLSLSYLSLTDGPDALREILRVHDFTDSPAVKLQIEGIVDVRSGPAFARIASELGLSFARGRRVELDLDEEHFAGGGVYLFASVLEQFLGLYASLNSFYPVRAHATAERTSSRMATKSGLEAAAVGRDPRPSVAAMSPEQFEETFRELLAEPWAFEFYQAVRLLERMSPTRTPVGEFGDPRAETVRFRTETSIAFPPSEISGFEAPDEEGDPPLMTVAFMGLTGPQGMLPLAYSSYVADRDRAGDHAIKEFLGIFEHRVLSLLYKARVRANAAAHDPGDGNWLTRHLFDLVGLGTGGMRHRLPMSDDALLFYAGLLGLPTRPAVALEQLVADYFNVPVRVEQFVGGWYPLDVSTQCELGNDASQSAQLGLGAVAGDETWDQQSRVRLRLGPLSRMQYDDFLPGGSAHEPLRALTRFFGDDQVDFEIQLVLARDQVPGVLLGMDGAESAPLGWCTWLRTSPLACDPDDTIFTL